jgi:hypothetical protein
MLLRVTAGALALALLACARSADLPTSQDFKLDVTVTPEATPPLDALNFVAHPVGDQEVPLHDTPAQGQAVFHLSADGTTMEYRLLVANITNVVASHIHIGPAGVNGPIVVFLFGNAPPGGGRVDGVLASGSFTAANFINVLAGHPMSDLIAALRSGNAYVNVHTNDGIPPTNTGPGDFPGGEIRDQVGGGHANH